MFTQHRFSLFAIGIAGSLGSLLRYSVSYFLTIETSHFPWATLLCNWTGTFVLMWMVTAWSNHTWAPWLRTAITTGLVGSYTTFSTFSLETVLLIHNHAYGIALLYVISSISGGILFAWLGFLMGHRKQKK
ncbi:fluoride efflux transporter FluC [Longirhabdus pacifica]|uniref:fluoride efflux transporter FluC n=1 Tax=Longirhabdus pacifica TaxID=2305227 RepID=UPI001008D258|nr:CrcB family protein [Longirhabdus pacifica]